MFTRTWRINKDLIIYCKRFSKSRFFNDPIKTGRVKVFLIRLVLINKAKEFIINLKNCQNVTVHMAQDFRGKFREVLQQNVDEQAMTFLRAFVGEFQGK